MSKNYPYTYLVYIIAIKPVSSRVTVVVVVYGKLGGNAVHGYRFLLDRVLFLLTVEDLVYRGGNIILKGLYNSSKKN